MKKIIDISRYLRRPSNFETLLLPHMEHLFQIAFRLTGSLANAEDLVQDTLIKVYPKRSELEQIEKLRPWLAKVLYRIFIDQQRQAARSPLHLVEPLPDNDSDVYDNIPSTAPGPEESILLRADQMAIMAALDSLPAEQRHVCILHDVEGYSLPELVGIMGIPIGTLKSRLHRARQALKKMLSEGTF